MEGVEESYRRQKQEVKLINDYHVLKGKCDDIYKYRYRHRPILVFINSYIYACLLNCHLGVIYKSGEPVAMMIDKSSKKQWGDEGGSLVGAPTVDDIKQALGGAKNAAAKSTSASGNQAKNSAEIVATAPVASKSQIKKGNWKKTFMSICTLDGYIHIYIYIYAYILMYAHIYSICIHTCTHTHRECSKASTSDQKGFFGSTDGEGQTPAIDFRSMSSFLLY